MLRKRYAFARIITIITVAIAVICIAGFNENVKIVNYDIYTSKITGNVKIVELADLHSTMYKENQDELIRAIENENPDVVFLVGDIVDNSLPSESAEIFLKKLGEKYTCYAVCGNHECYSDKAKMAFTANNIKLLDGETLTINVNGQKISLSGINDPCPGYDLWKSSLIKCNEQKDSNLFTILLSHRPEYPEDYKTCNFDMILCGHTHGGQARIPGIINGIYCPLQGWFPKYTGGLYKIGKSDMIVSRGLVVNNVPRVFNRPEIVTVSLIPQRQP